MVGVSLFYAAKRDANAHGEKWNEREEILGARCENDRARRAHEEIGTKKYAAANIGLLKMQA